MCHGRMYLAYFCTSRRIEVHTTVYNLSCNPVGCRSKTEHAQFFIDVSPDSFRVGNRRFSTETLSEATDLHLSKCPHVTYCELVDRIYFQAGLHW